MGRRTVREEVLGLLRHFDMTVVFSNPGSTEIDLLTDLPDDLTFVLGLHEGSVVGMATGHAIGSSRPALVVLHTTAGLGNAAGALATARANGAPLVVVVGQQDRRHLVNEPFLAGKLRGLAGEYPVWVAEPARAEDVPALVARAWHEAAARRGPALVIVPMNDWDVELAEQFELAAPKRLVSATSVNPSAIAEVSACLQAARRPVIISGSGADEARTWEALRRLAGALGAPVWQEPFGARAAFPQDDVFFAGHLPATRSGVREALREHDLVVVIGAAALRQYPYEPGPLFDATTTAVGLAGEFDDIASGILDLAVVGPLPALCESLAAAVADRGAPPPPSYAPPEADSSTGQLAPDVVYAEIGKRLDPEVVVFEESPSSRHQLHEQIRVRRPLGFVSAAMGGLGFAMPAAAGLRLACPARPVLAIVGDGSAMYSIQALWSAQAYRIGVLYIVMSNGGYAIMDKMAHQRAGKAPWPSDFGLDICAIARGLGCEGLRVDSLAGLRAALDEILPGLASRTSPILIDVALAAGAPDEPPDATSDSAARL